jgi:Fe-Mn family superoxide dismutase
MSGKVGRREFVTAMGMGSLAAAVSAGTVGAASNLAVPPSEGVSPLEAFRGGDYVLPPLPYAKDSLEPVLSTETLSLHHGKHHQGYVNGLNATLRRLAEARESGEFSQVKGLSRDLAFHGSGHILHTLYWNSMTPGGGEPTREFAAAIEKDFGSVEAMQAHFAAATGKAEASGWGILAYEPVARRLMVLQAEKHQNLAIWGVVPLLVCDVWEHAYYVDYRNQRASYVEGFMEIADWSFAGRRLATVAAS